MLTQPKQIGKLAENERPNDYEIIEKGITSM